MAVIRPERADAVAAELTRAHSAGQSVLPMGHATRLRPGGFSAGVDLAVSTTQLDRVLQYEPADLTVTVEAGCDLGILASVLAEHRQFLPLQHLRGHGTVGGLVATAAEGVVALGYGAVRDRLIGLKAALADGSIVRGGGRVVKNVAGYAIHRLMTGSFGTLGVIVEASFKVHPRPETEATILFELASARAAFEAARLILDRGLEPSFVNVLVDASGSCLAVGFDGFETRVQAHLKRVGDVVAPTRPEGCRVLRDEEGRALRRTLDDPVAGAPAVMRPAVDGPGVGPPTDLPPGAAAPLANRQVLADRERQLVVRLTALPAKIEMMAVRAHEAARGAGAAVRMDARPGTGSAYLVITAPGQKAAGSTEARKPLLERDEARKPLEPDEAGKPLLELKGAASVPSGHQFLEAGLRAALGAARSIGSAVVVSAPPSLEGEFDPWGPAPPDFFLMKGIKQALDPKGLFAAGRFVGGL